MMTLNLSLIFVCLIIGTLLRRVKSLPSDASITLNSLILYVPFPAMILLELPLLKWNLNLLTLCLVAWIIFAFSYLIFSSMGKRLGWGDELTGCMILTSGLCNTSFVGFPIIEALYGPDALKHAFIIDQPGSFLLVSSLGLWVAAKYSNRSFSKKNLALKISTFPPFVAFVIAVIIGICDWKMPHLLINLLSRLSSLLTPLALISVGLQLSFKGFKQDAKYLALGLGFKLLLAPALIYLIYRPLNLESEVFKVVVMESAMAPMITGAILAAAHGLSARLAGMMVGIGVPLSFLTLGFWYTLLKFSIN